MTSMVLATHEGLAAALQRLQWQLNFVFVERL
jgi:hypothetical protein